MFGRSPAKGPPDSMRLTPLVLALALAFVPACASQQADAPQSPAAAAADLKGQGPALAELQRAVAGQPAANPLVIRESALAGVKLGAKQADVRRVLGEPTRRETASGGTWWEYDPQNGRPGQDQALRLWFSGDEATLIHIQAWAPSEAETVSMIRVLDPAVRLTRKYGAPAAKVAWGGRGAEAWLYPAANVGYVVSRPLETGSENRVVAGILVGLTAAEAAAPATPASPAPSPSAP